MLRLDESFESSGEKREKRERAEIVSGKKRERERSILKEAEKPSSMNNHLEQLQLRSPRIHLEEKRFQLNSKNCQQVFHLAYDLLDVDLLGKPIGKESRRSEKSERREIDRRLEMSDPIS